MCTIIITITMQSLSHHRLMTLEKEKEEESEEGEEEEGEEEVEMAEVVSLTEGAHGAVLAVALRVKVAERCAPTPSM